MLPEHLGCQRGVQSHDDVHLLAVLVDQPKRVTVNAISLGGVKTSLNDSVMNDKDKFAKIMEVTPMKKWMDVDEVCDWVYFLTCKNKSASGQNILIDNGEHDLNDRFVW